MLWDAIENSDYDRVVTLVESGANINAKNDDGESPLHFAAMYGNVQITRFLLSTGADIRIVDDEGNTPLHWAAAAGQLHQVRLLIDHGAAADAQNKMGQTAAERCGHEHIADFLRTHTG